MRQFRQSMFIQDRTIRGEALKLAREKAGFSERELATLATLSIKQLSQIENGGDESFYSPAIKFRAARKVAEILKLSDDEWSDRSR